MSQRFQQTGRWSEGRGRGGASNPRPQYGGGDGRSGRNGGFRHDRDGHINGGGGGGGGGNTMVPPRSGDPPNEGSHFGGGGSHSHMRGGPNFGDGRGGPSNHNSRFGGGDRGGPWNHHPHFGGSGDPPNQGSHIRGGPNFGDGGGRGGPSNHNSRFGGGDRGGPWNHHPHHPGDTRPTRDMNHSTVTRSIPDLHQANQISYKLPDNTSEVGSTSSSQIVEKKNNTYNISEQFRELLIQPNSSSSSKFPLRPNFGTNGRKCAVTANHFLITLHPSIGYIHHYHVDIQPEIKTKKLNRAVMEELVRSYKQSYLGNMLLAYDGQSSFYTASSLPFNSKEFEVTIANDGGVRKQYVVAISLVSVIDLQKLQEFLAGKHDDSAQEAIQAFDVVLRQTPLSKFVPVKRSFHTKDRSTVIAGGLEAWSGFYQSVRPTQNGLSLNIDISAAVFVQNLKVTKFVEKILNYRELSKTKQLSDVERLKVKRALKGLRVEVEHRKNGRRRYTVSGITKEPTKELNFALGDNGEMKYIVQYFKEKYGRNLEYTSLPCLQVGNKAILLPMEVCTIIGGQRYTKRLNENQTSDMVKLNSQKPRDRAIEILKTVYENDYLTDEYAKEFGINVAKTPASVQARMLPSPQLSYHDSDTSFQPKFGQWNLINKKMFEGGTVSSWSCINFAVSDFIACKFCEKLASLCNAYGMNFNSRSVLRPHWARAEKVERELETLQKDARARLKGKELDLLIVILPDNNGSLYGDVKRICETKLGLVSQCVLAETVQGGRTQALANIVLKINAKVGGVNVVLKDPIPMVSDRPTIIFGADVTHPSPGEDTSQSIAAVVASYNWPNVTNYVPKFSTQTGRKEIIQDLGRMVREHFQSFVDNNNKRPERIIFYRDGVSEGQFSQVLADELTAIRKAWLDEFNGSIVPPITFVVVQKRHHTKLFPVRTEDKSGNISAGTVVDTDICHPSQFDFYLCSHAGIKGTSRPAHYHVLWDDNKFTADQLQTLTNNLCYIYARCTRSVSYVSPAYYAHLAAFRARFYLGDDSFSDESSAAGRVSQATDAPVKQLPPLCDNLKNLQFYC